MPKAKKKKVKTKVKRLTNGQIIKGSSRLKGSGRPKGARSTGKKIKSVSTRKSSASVKSIKSVGDSVKPNKIVDSKYISKVKIKRSTKGVKRNSKGQLVKGTVSISPGRPAGNSRVDELNMAIAQVQSERGKKDWLRELVRRSYKDNTLAVAILARKFPVLKSVYLETNIYDAADKQDAADIREEMKGRFEPAKTIEELKAKIEKLEDIQQSKANMGVQDNA